MHERREGLTDELQQMSFPDFFSCLRGQSTTYAAYRGTPLSTLAENVRQAILSRKYATSKGQRH